MTIEESTLPQTKTSTHRSAVMQALFVTFLWSTSWVLIKIGLRDLPALTFAGLRYTLAFLALIPFAFHSSRRDGFSSLTRRDWIRLLLLGVLYYTITQGAQFVGLQYLPAVAVSLLFNFTSLIVALLGIIFLSERPTGRQWIGIGLFLLGIVIYFFPVAFGQSQWLGVAVMLLGVLANALSSVLGRDINRRGSLSPLLVTTISMGIGSVLLLISGIAVQGLPALTPLSWLIIVWLALVNTAFAFTLWNHTLRVLPAMESSIINGTMLVQIALLAWIFLGEALTPQKIAGMVLSGLGALIVQMRKR